MERERWNNLSRLSNLTTTRMTEKHREFFNFSSKLKAKWKRYNPSLCPITCRTRRWSIDSEHIPHMPDISLWKSLLAIEGRPRNNFYFPPFSFATNLQNPQMNQKRENW